MREREKERERENERERERKRERERASGSAGDYRCPFHAVISSVCMCGILE